MPSLVEIGQVELKKKIFKCHQCNIGISLISPLGNGPVPSCKQTWNPFKEGCFVTSFVECTLGFWRRSQSIFAILLLSLFGKGHGP